MALENFMSTKILAAFSFRLRVVFSPIEVKAGLSLCLGVLSMDVFAVEEPEFELLAQQEPFELRRDAPTITAEVEVSGDMKRAGNAGFRALADYIFGNNITVNRSGMTKSVSKTSSQKIKMTAPVTRTELAEDKWKVAFTMPSKWTLETLPQPSNPEVQIKWNPEQIFAVIRFSGSWKEAKHAQKRSELEAWLLENNYEAVGPARYAGYNPPWILPPFRRNEVMIPVAVAFVEPAH